MPGTWQETKFKKITPKPPKYLKQRSFPIKSPFNLLYQK